MVFVCSEELSWRKKKIKKKNKSFEDLPQITNSIFFSATNLHFFAITREVLNFLIQADLYERNSTQSFSLVTWCGSVTAVPLTCGIKSRFYLIWPWKSPSGTHDLFCMEALPGVGPRCSGAAGLWKSSGQLPRAELPGSTVHAQLFQLPSV